INWVQGSWHLITFVYPSWEEGSPVAELCVDGQVIAWENANFAFYGDPPSKAGRARNGFSIGSNRDGAEQAFGTFAELETFNYPLSDAEIATKYYTRAGMSVQESSAHIPDTSSSTTVIVELDDAQPASFA